MLTKEEFIEGTTLQLDLWGDQFATLEEHVAESPLKQGKGIRRRIAALRKKKRSLKRQLREAAHDPQRDWEDVRGELENEVRAFRTRAAEVHDKVTRV